jgi:hypothetical protein
VPQHWGHLLMPMPIIKADDDENRKFLNTLVIKYAIVVYFSLLLTFFVVY